MTEPERPADAPPGSPTPEEISARLEALLKRTHAMRAEQKASGSPAAMTWPPPDRELDHYDVVDMDDKPRPTATPAPAAAGPGTADAKTPAVSATAQGGASPEFARSDWSELRLRGAADDAPRAARWLPVLTVLLALATLGQAGYLWYLHENAPAGTAGRLRVDGPDGALVRVNGQDIGPAPIDYALDSGDYEVEIVEGAAVTRSQHVSIAGNRTVVMLPMTMASGSPSAPRSVPDAPAAGTRQAATPAESGATRPAALPRAAAPVPVPAAPVPAAPTTAAGGVTATLGAVVIESTPAGLPVTMEGRERGVTPIRIGQLKPGRHDVLVGGLARKVDVTAGQVATLRVTRP